MIGLNEKYADVIKTMMEDAQENVAEAEGKVTERSEKLRECRETVKQLKTTANTSHKGFFKVVKEIGKLAITKNPSPEDVSRAIGPCHMYKIAAEQLPIAEKDFKDAKEKLRKAQEELDEASNALANISFFA